MAGNSAFGIFCIYGLYRRTLRLLWRARIKGEVWFFPVVWLGCVSLG